MQIRQIMHPQNIFDIYHVTQSNLQDYLPPCSCHTVTFSRVTLLHSETENYDGLFLEALSSQQYLNI